MKEILRAHFQKYPEMQPQDAVKLCFQSEFGGGHMIPSKERALARLTDEIEQTPQTDGTLLEDIGGYYRLYLRSMQNSGLRPETLNGLFCYTAAHACGTKEGFAQKLEALEEITNEGGAPFAPGDLAQYLAEYRAQGSPVVSHTPHYREHYSPAYRLVPRETARLLPLLCAIDKVLCEKGTVCVGIDGMCGAGKSTLAAVLQQVYDAQLMHMDDYFLPFARKTPERLAEPGGNVDYERFYEEVARVPPGEAICYRAFDCSTGALGEPVNVPAAPVRIVEGSYALHPYFGDIYDVRAWISVTPEMQRERILHRNGPEMLRRFVEKWIPMENHYAQANSLPRGCVEISGT